MNLNALAEKDLSFTLEDSENGFAQEFILKDAAGSSYELCGIINDIGFSFDTEGNAISSRNVSASFRLSKLTDEEGNYIRPGTGWAVEWCDMSGKKHTAYVRDFRPDRRLGVGLLILDLEFGKANGN